MNASQRSNSNDGGFGEFRTEPLYRRFELRGQPLSAALGLLRAFDQRSDQEVAIRRVSNRIDPSVLRSLLAFDPNTVVPVAEVLRDDDGPYLVSPLPHGTLADRLEHGPLDADEIARVTFDLALGLSTMHAAGCAPMDPRPDTISTSLDGRMRLMAIAAPLDAVENTAIAAPFAHDLRTLGRTLVALARGQQSETAIDVDAAPMSLRPLIRGCLAAGTPQGFADAAGLLAALGHDPGPQAGSDTLLDTGEVLDLAESTAGGTAQGYADTTTAKRTRGGATSGSGSGSGSRSKSTATPFPFRKLSDLYEIVGGPKTGGMGAVHMAVERATQRKVAVKRLKTRDVDSSILERFYREAHAIASLNHPHILQLLQPGRDDEGDYLILEWASGGSLKDALGKSPALPEAQVLDIARKIGSALAYAHSKGVIHRDIKPHNILLTETGEPKLADFGLARQVDDLTLSTSKHGAGSPLYMAPEQHNSTRDADARSDLYSFGKTLYQLATGKLPNSPDPRLLPASLRGPIMRCMEEEPERRPGSVNEFLRDLERASRPVSARVAILALAALVVTIGAYALRDKWQPKRPVTDPQNIAANPDVRDPETNSVRARPQPILGSLLALVGSQEQDVANGATAANHISMRIQFEGAAPTIDPKQVSVERNDQPLPDAQVIQDKDGLRVVAALTSGANEFRIKVADLGTVTSPSIERTFPKPQLDAIDGAFQSGGDWVTGGEFITLRGTVARAIGMKVLVLESSNGEKLPVELEDDRFRTRILFPQTTAEGAITYDWRMPPDYGNGRLEGGPIRVVIDRSAPQLELVEPKAGALLTTAVSELRVRGRVIEPNRKPDAKVEIELVENGAPLSDSKRNLEVTSTNEPTIGDFEFVIPLSADLAQGEVDLVLRAQYRDAAGLTGSAQTAFRIDRKAPALVTESGKPEIRVSQNSDGTASIMVSGVASETLKRATVNGRDAGIQDRQFAIAGLEEAKSFTLVLEDLAGNRSEPKTFDAAFDFDRVAPQVQMSFGASENGFAVAMLSPSERLKSLTVNGHAAEPTADGSYVATLEHLLADLRDPTWGPTHDPITIVAIDMAGNETKQVVMIAPVLYGGKDPFGPIAIPLIGDAAHGRYCPRAVSHHKPSAKRPDVHEDYFIEKGAAQCGLCGFQP